MNSSGQRILQSEQIQAFYHNEFVDDQVSDFLLMSSDLGSDNSLLCDLGGGCGFFVEKITQSTNIDAYVLDIDQGSIQLCRDRGIKAEFCDILKPTTTPHYNFVCFNMILHHLVSSNEQGTEDLQISALSVWKEKSDFIFINEYIYDSYVEDWSGWLIFQITKSYILSKVGNFVALIFKSLFANTFGTGVRFRSHASWLKIIEKSGCEVVRYTRGTDEKIPLPRKILLIKSWRRDSFIIRKDIKP